MRMSAVGDPELMNQLRKAFYPWGYFFIFLTLGFVFSYSSLSFEVKAVLFLLGFIVPIVFWFFSRHRQSPAQHYFDPSAPIKSFEIWILLITAIPLIWIRFYRLTTLSYFPTVDEGSLGFPALEHLHNWNWRIVSGDDLGFPFSLGLNLVFRVFEPSYFSLMLYPALLSSACILLSYFAFRQLFSFGHALICFLLFGFGFWSLYAARFCMEDNLMLLVEFLALIVFGNYLRNEKESGVRLWAAVLGVVCGIGFYTYAAWTVVAGMVFAAVLYGELKKKPLISCTSTMIFSFFMVLTVLPMVWAVVFQDSGHYVKYLVSTGTFNKLWAIFERGFDYLTAVFWGSKDPVYFGPVWGGMLNPVWGSLFLMGLLECVKSWKLPVVRWIVLGIGAHFFLVMFAYNVIICRVSGALPAMCVIATIGFLRLFRDLKPILSFFFLVAVFLSSFVLDFHHLMLAPTANQWSGARIQWQDPTLQNNYWAAEQIFKEKAAQDGPGLIFTYFNELIWDQTLTLVTYPYNAALNSKYNPESAGWFALLVDRNEKALLLEKYPQGKIYWLSENLKRKGDQYLLVVEITPETSKDSRQLLAAHQKLGSFMSMMAEHQLYVPDPIFTKKWIEMKTVFKKSPFLENYYYVNYLNFASADKDPVECLSAVDGYFETEGSNRLFFNALAKNVRQPVLYPAAEVAAEKAVAQYGLLSSHYFKKGDAVESRYFHELQGETFVLMNLFCSQMNQSARAAVYLVKARKLLGPQADIYLKRMMDYKDKPLQANVGGGA